MNMEFFEVPYHTVEEGFVRILFNEYTVPGKISFFPYEMYSAIRCETNDDDENYVDIPEAIFIPLKKKWDKYQSLVQLQNKTCELNNIGIAQEKSGDIENAIKTYEENVKLKGKATHSYERLMILYRKAKDYKNEIRVIKIAIKVFPKEQKYKDRLDKALSLLNNQNV